MSINNYDNYDLGWRPTIINNGKPIYKQLLTQLIEDIRLQNLHSGDRMPPQRELADFLEISLTTVTRVYKKGEELGLLSAQVGKGTFISFGINIEEQLLYDEQYQDIIQMATIHPPYNNNFLFQKILRELTDQPNFSKLLEYQSPNGTLRQRKSILKFLKKFGFQGSKDNLIITTGAQNALAGILIGLFQPGERIAVTNLVFPGLKAIAKMQGIKLISIPDQIIKKNYVSKEFTDFLVSENIKGLYLVPEHNNPTTETLSEVARRNIAKAITDSDVLLIEDTVNRVFCEEKVTPIASLAPENTIYIFSTSKFMAAGFRIAYVFTPKRLMNVLDKTFYNINLMPSPLNLEVVTRVLDGEFLNTIISEKLKELRERDRIVTQILGQKDIKGESTCCFRWILLPEYWDSAEFEKESLKKGVKVFGSEKFIVGHQKPPRAIRICISSPKNKNDLRKGLEILKKLIVKKP